jgi:hypothetical protein
MLGQGEAGAPLEQILPPLHGDCDSKVRRLLAPSSPHSHFWHQRHVPTTIAKIFIKKIQFISKDLILLKKNCSIFI